MYIINVMTVTVTLLPKLPEVFCFSTKLYECTKHVPNKRMPNSSSKYYLITHVIIWEFWHLLDSNVSSPIKMQSFIYVHICIQYMLLHICYYVRYELLCGCEYLIKGKTFARCHSVNVANASPQFLGHVNLLGV